METFAVKSQALAAQRYVNALVKAGRSPFHFPTFPWERGFSSGHSHNWMGFTIPTAPSRWEYRAVLPGQTWDQLPSKGPINQSTGTRRELGEGCFSFLCASARPSSVCGRCSAFSRHPRAAAVLALLPSQPFCDL